MPEEIRSLLAEAGVGTDRAAVEPTPDGRWLVATAKQLLCVGEDVESVGYWCELQNATWEAKTGRLTVAYVDPEHPPFTAETTSADPRQFMGAVREGVDNAVVAQRQAIADNDTRLIASVRRGPEGELFSMLVAYGALSQEGLQLADQLEAQVREDVGLT